MMTESTITVWPEEPVGVAARLLEHYNIGALPVCGADGKLKGMVTDRDLAVRCLTGTNPGEMRVGDVMTRQVRSIGPEAEISEAASVMGREQIRRLPVVENGRLCGMVSMGDLAANGEAGIMEVLQMVSRGMSRR